VRIPALGRKKMNKKYQMTTLRLTPRFTPNSSEGKNTSIIKRMASVKSEILFNLISWATLIHCKA
jgi:hypothetical protein